MNYPTQSHALKSHIEDEPWKKQKLISLYFSLIPLVLWMTSNPSAFLGWLLVDGVRKQRGWVSACIFKRKKKKGSNIWKNMIFPTICNQCEVKVENKLRKGGQSLICIKCLMCNYYMLCMTECQATSEIFSIWMVSILEKDAKILEFICYIFQTTFQWFDSFGFLLLLSNMTSQVKLM